MSKWLAWRKWMKDNGYMTMEDIPLLKDRANCKIAFLKAPHGYWLEPKDEFLDDNDR